jgi:alpha-glucoside transport system permease protein
MKAPMLAHRRIPRLGTDLGLGLVAVLWLIPAVGLAVASLSPQTDLQDQGWWKLFTRPSHTTAENYSHLFSDHTLTKALISTIVITLGATAVTALVGAMAAYALAWHPFLGRDWLFFFVVALLGVPIQIALIPMVKLYSGIGLYDTYVGMILFHVAFGLPFAIFLLTSYFAELPRDLVEAARMDGASELLLFWRVMLPLAWPAIASVSILEFVAVWNDLVVGLVMSQNVQPLIPLLTQQLVKFQSNLGLIAAGGFIAAVVPALIFLLFQRVFVRGLLSGAVK